MEITEEQEERRIIHIMCKGSCGMDRTSRKAALRLAGEMAIAAGELEWQQINDNPE